MNVIAKSIFGVAKAIIGNSVQGAAGVAKVCSGGGIQGSMLNTTRLGLVSILQGLQQVREKTLYQLHRQGPHIKKRKNKNPFDGAPFMKGVILKTIIKKPKKPNSANRKCVIVRLANGKEMTAYVPGVGHNLQEHNIVLCRVGRLRDTPGVRIKCVRGKYDLPHVVKASK